MSSPTIPGRPETPSGEIENEIEQSTAGVGKTDNITKQAGTSQEQLDPQKLDDNISGQNQGHLGGETLREQNHEASNSEGNGSVNDSQSEDEDESYTDAEQSYIRYFNNAPNSSILRETAEAATDVVHQQFLLLRLLNRRTKCGKKRGKAYRALSEQIRELKEKIEVLRRKHYLILQIGAGRSPPVFDAESSREPATEQIGDQIWQEGFEEPALTAGGVSTEDRTLRNNGHLLDLDPADIQNGTLGLGEQQADTPGTPSDVNVRTPSRGSSLEGDQQGSHSRRRTVSLGSIENQDDNMTVRPELPIGSLPDHLYPKQFNNSDKKRPFSLFVRDYEALSRACNWSSATACRWIQAWLTGDARVRYNTLPDSVKQGTDYGTLITQLTALFNPPSEAGFALQRFHTSKRDKDETLESYSDRLNMLLRQAEPNLTSTARQKFVMNRILATASREIQLAFAAASARPTTLREFIESATAIEDTAKRADEGTVKDSLANIQDNGPTNYGRTGADKSPANVAWNTPNGSAGTASNEQRPMRTAQAIPPEGCLGCSSLSHRWKDCDEFKQPSWLKGFGLSTLLQLARRGKSEDGPIRNGSDRTVRFQDGMSPYPAPLRGRANWQSSQNGVPPYRGNGGPYQGSRVMQGQQNRFGYRAGTPQYRGSRPQYGDTNFANGNPRDGGGRNYQTTGQNGQRPFYRRDQRPRPWNNNRQQNPNRIQLTNSWDDNPNQSFSPSGPGGENRNMNFRNPKNGYSNQNPRFQQ